MPYVQMAPGIEVMESAVWERGASACVRCRGKGTRYATVVLERYSWLQWPYACSSCYGRGIIFRQQPSLTSL